MAIPFFSQRRGSESCLFIGKAGVGWAWAVLLVTAPVLRAETLAHLADNQKPASDQALPPVKEKRAAALAHWVASQLALSENHGREALAEALKAVAADPEDSSLVVETAKLAARFQGREAAYALLEQHVKAHPNSLIAYGGLIEFTLTYPAPGDDPYQPAIEVAEEALKKFPQEASAFALAVKAHLAASGTQTKGDAAKAERERAEQILEDALQQNVPKADFWLTLGRSAQDVWPLADPEHRKEHQAKINPYFEKALHFIGHDKDDEMELAVADYFLLSNQLDRSLTICEKIVRRSGNLEGRRRVVRLLDAMDRPDEALKALEDVTRAFPADVESRRLLAQVYIQKLDVDRAVPQLEAALQYGGGDLQDYVVICRMMRASKSPEKFFQFTQRASQLYPGEPHVMLYRGVALLQLKRYDEASTLFQKTAQVAEVQAPDCLDHDFYFQHGVALERTGHIEEAARQFEKSIELTPFDNLETAAGAMNYLGYMWLEQGTHLERAEELIKKANELTKPESASIVDSLGWVYFKRGKYDEALQTLLHAESLQKEWDPDDAEILDHIAQTYEKLGQQEKAREYWKRALDLKPSSEDVRRHAEKALGLNTPVKPVPPEPGK